VTPVTNHRGRLKHLFHKTTPSIAVFWTSLHFLGQLSSSVARSSFRPGEMVEATAMPKQKKSKAEIAKKLAQANRLARQGKLQSEIARTLGVSAMTLHRWRKALLEARPARKADQPDPTRSGDQIAQLQLENSLLRRLITDLLVLEKIKRRHQRAVGGPF
jgi:transposase-like protein